MMDKMPCSYGTVKTTGVRIRNQVSHRAFAEVLAAFEVSRRACAEVLAVFEVSGRPAQWTSQLKNLSILIFKFCSILNAPPSVQVFSIECETTLVESESTLQSSRGGWEHLEALQSTGEGYQSVWEVCIWLPDQNTFC